MIIVVIVIIIIIIIIIINIIIIIIIISIIDGRIIILQSLPIDSKRRRAERFEAGCQCALLNVQITMPYNLHLLYT